MPMMVILMFINVNEMMLMISRDIYITFQRCMHTLAHCAWLGVIVVMVGGGEGGPNERGGNNFLQNGQ